MTINEETTVPETETETVTDTVPVTDPYKNDSTIKDILKAVEDKSYTDFYKKVADELNLRVSNDPSMKKKIDDYERLQKMNTLFKEIQKTAVS